MLQSENNAILSNSILSIYALIPKFNYHKTMYKENIMERLGVIAGTCNSINTRLHALALIKKLIDNA